jgi:hypothetical protein
LEGRTIVKRDKLDRLTRVLVGRFRKKRIGVHIRWDPVIGPQAADSLYKEERARKRSAFSIIVAAGGCLSAAALHARQSGAAAFVVAFVLGLASTFGWLSVGGRHRQAKYLAASLFLRFDVNGSNFPPPRPDLFARWCKRHHVQAPGSRSGSDILPSKIAPTESANDEQPFV